MDTKTAAALASFVATAQDIVDAYFAKHCPVLKASKLSVQPGRRYAKIVTTRTNQDGSADVMSRSVYCFVDLTNGDVLKAETWRKPAKHARANIFASDFGASGINEHGANYL